MQSQKDMLRESWHRINSILNSNLKLNFYNTNPQAWVPGPKLVNLNCFFFLPHSYKLKHLQWKCGNLCQLLSCVISPTNVKNRFRFMIHDDDWYWTCLEFQKTVSLNKPSQIITQWSNWNWCLTFQTENLCFNRENSYCL